MKSCIVCGAENEGGVVLCAGCGADLRSTTAPRRNASSGKEQDPPGAAGLLLEPGLWTQSKIGRRQVTTKTGERHFLVPRLGEPLRLEAGPPLVIGRGKGCEVRIVSPTVSRRHAEILFRGNPLRAFLKDLGTRNGTHVNDERLTDEHELRDHDSVRIGDVTAVYRLLPKGANEASLLEGQTPESLSQTLAIDDEEAPTGRLEGDLARESIADLLLRLRIEKATGELGLESGGKVGHARFENGEIKAIRFGALEGAEATAAVGSLDEGRFRFEPGRA